jgi:hypothetical protein
MFNTIWTYIVTHISLINPTVWILLFLVSIIYDIVYTKSVLHISRLDAAPAANLSVILYLMMAYGTVNYMSNLLNLIPISIGAWLGTYAILKYEKFQYNKHKKENEKIKEPEFIKLISVSNVIPESEKQPYSNSDSENSLNSLNDEVNKNIDQTSSKEKDQPFQKKDDE